MSIETQPRSVSQTEQYEKCGWRFYLQRVERVTPSPAAWSIHGRAFHSAAEAYEKSDRTMSAEEAVVIFSDEYEAETNKALDEESNTDRWLSAGRYSGGEDIERRYALGQKQTAYYVEWAKEKGPVIWKTPDGVPALELYFMVELGGVQVRGYIDQLVTVKDAVRPRDLKTGSMKSKFQLQTYGIAVRELYGVEVNDADWYLAKDGRLSRPVKLDQVSADELGERYAAMDAGVKAGSFPARPGYDCRFCDVAHACSFFSAKS
ncbi:RecB family exonuclease [Streptomyces graminilatus]|uniref:RecB family exonuclease n=1 Tax=Streptomyces graminilatus TaxID=1464070 RepID=UPI0007C7649C|nr:PD-(D/E)XK nuclease family protein [Streptomyces graminilatus]